LWNLRIEFPFWVYVRNIKSFDHKFLCSLSGRSGAFVGFVLDATPVRASIAGLRVCITVLVVVVVAELGAVVAGSLSPILAVVSVVAGVGNDIDGGNRGEDGDLKGGGVSGDKSESDCDCDVDCACGRDDQECDVACTAGCM